MTPRAVPTRPRPAPEVLPHGVVASPRSRLATRATVAAGVTCVVVGVALAATSPAPDVGVLPTVSGPAAPGPELPAAATPFSGVVPTTVELPDRGVSAPVVPTGTDPTGALAVPELPTVGWWAPGALAGAAAGTTVLAGHVDSAAAGIGSFAVLREVAPGERVVLRGADGRALTYRTTARRQVVKAALPADLFTSGGPPRLVLITCGGRFDPATRHYADNVIVYATPE